MRRPLIALLLGAVWLASLGGAWYGGTRQSHEVTYADCQSFPIRGGFNVSRMNAMESQGYRVIRTVAGNDEFGTILVTLCK